MRREHLTAVYGNCMPLLTLYNYIVVSHNHAIGGYTLNRGQETSKTAKRNGRIKWTIVFPHKEKKRKETSSSALSGIEVGSTYTHLSCVFHWEPSY